MLSCSNRDVSIMCEHKDHQQDHLRCQIVLEQKAGGSFYDCYKHLHIQGLFKDLATGFQGMITLLCLPEMSWGSLQDSWDTRGWRCLWSPTKMRRGWVLRDVCKNEAGASFFWRKAEQKGSTRWRNIVLLQGRISDGVRWETLLSKVHRRSYNRAAVKLCKVLSAFAFHSSLKTSKGQDKLCITLNYRAGCVPDVLGFYTFFCLLLFLSLFIHVGFAGFWESGE